MLVLCSASDRQAHVAPVVAITAKPIGNLPVLPCFAPPMALVMAHKRGEISWKVYRAHYLYLLQSDEERHDGVCAWLEGLTNETRQTLVCFCGRQKLIDGGHCHREIVAEIVSTSRPDITYLLR